MREKLAVEPRNREAAAGTNIIKCVAVASRLLMSIIADGAGDVSVEYYFC
jgi:hypothetical protein